MISKSSATRLEPDPGCEPGPFCTREDTLWQRALLAAWALAGVVYGLAAAEFSTQGKALTAGRGAGD